ncbi:hypothetical protein [Nitrosopumilus sp. b2]|uniref:hypothetical protein n=1 Tax=Nitrosopumilus sp. b2 TaxID=2109908 RepID=UPI0015F52A13|nr:hypothetical protein [Nitrosopumilus sp. b2]KAF6245801.1 hypothetical protein C6989_01320 [Nitrosopumilus sp. b2]
MNKATGGIIGGIIVFVIIFGIILSLNPDSDVAEVEDTLDKEILPIDVPEIEEKLNEIEEIANSTEYEILEREWQTSGPFQIDRKEYAIGEKIFIRIGGLQYLEKGQIAVMMPLNATHQKVYLTIPFDESKKSAFNYYLEPQLTASRDICSVDDLIGKWTLVFRGTEYQNLYFKIIDKVVPGTNVEPVC